MFRRRDLCALASLRGSALCPRNKRGAQHCNWSTCFFWILDASYCIINLYCFIACSSSISENSWESESMGRLSCFFSLYYNPYMNYGSTMSVKTSCDRSSEADGRFIELNSSICNSKSRKGSLVFLNLLASLFSNPPLESIKFLR